VNITPNLSSSSSHKNASVVAPPTPPKVYIPRIFDFFKLSDKGYLRW
jgi:hypothetical protein